MTILGVDLGTAFARAAVATDKGPLLLQFSDGAHALPAVVAYQKGSVLVGRAAVGKAAMRPETTVRGVKRLLGRAPTDPLVAAIARYATYGIQPREDGAMNLVAGGEVHAPEDVAAAILKQLADTAEEQTGVRPATAVLTVPYWFGPRERAALGESAHRAGLETRQVMSEGTAIALSLASAEPHQRKIAIADVGAGGATVSILDVGPERVVLLACTGDPVGGGDDIDRTLLSALLKSLRARFGDFQDSPAVSEMIRQVCEGMKRDIGQLARVRAVIPFLPVAPAGAHQQEVTVDRERFDALIADSLARVEAACHGALAQAGVAPSDLAAVYATGGLSNLPAVRVSVERPLGTITGRRLDPDGAVALGAALMGCMLEGTVDAIPVLDVKSPSISPPRLAASLPPFPVQSVVPPGPSSRSSTPAPRSAAGAGHPPTGESPEDTTAFRLEVARLLASIRAGAVTGRGSKKKQQLVVRTNEALDDDDLLDAGRRAEMGQRLSGIFRQLGLALQAIRQYRWDHPMTTRHLESALREIEGAHGFAPRSVRFEVGSTHFAYDRVPVWKPDRPPFDRVPYQLFADGLRRVQFKPGLELPELRDFLSIIIGAASGFAADEDAVTALWDKRFTKIAHLAVDAFVETDDPAFDGDCDEMTRDLLQSFGADADLEESEGGLFAGQREAVDEAAAFAIPEASRDAVRGGIEADAAEYSARHDAALGAAWEEAERFGDLGVLVSALDALGSDRLAAGDVDALFADVQRLAAAAGAGKSKDARDAVERAVTSAMLPPGRFEALFQRLSVTKVLPETAGAIARALELVGDASTTEAAWSAYWGGSPELRGALFPYLLATAETHEAALARCVREGEVDHALSALSRLAALGSSASRAAIHEAFASPHVDVRIAAMIHLPDASPEKLRGELTRLVEDPDASVRVRALAMVTKVGAATAGPVLVHRIVSPAFNALPLSERKLVLASLAQLNPRRAEAIAIELLDTRHLVPSHALDETRAAAASLLSEASSAEALEALRTAAKNRWGTSALVREAAAAALAAIVARRGAAQENEK